MYIIVLYNVPTYILKKNIPSIYSKVNIGSFKYGNFCSPPIHFYKYMYIYVCIRKSGAFQARIADTHIQVYLLNNHNMFAVYICGEFIQRERGTLLYVLAYENILAEKIYISFKLN